MKAYNRWRQDVVPKLGTIVEMASLGHTAMRELTPGDDGPGFRDYFIRKIASGEASDYMQPYIDILPNDRAVFTGIMSNTVISRHLLNGPKVYCPSQGEYAALCQIEPNVPWEDYQQPFQTFCMVIPENVAMPINPTIGRPVCVLVDYEAADRRLIAYIPCEPPAVVPKGVGVTKYDVCMVRTPSERDASPSEFLKRWLEVDSADRSSVLDYGIDTTDIRGASARVVAAAVNACLLLTRHGAIHRGKANPGHAADLERSLGKRKLPDKLRAALGRELQMMPDIYSFSQEIRLHDTEGEPGEPGDPTGREMTTHWRRGHWARQRHGVGRAETKLIFRKPVLVRADRFAGDLANTGAVYQGA